MSKAIYCLRTNKRSFYLAMTVFWLAVEVVIACYVHDRFIRPYVGDVLVVVSGFPKGSGFCRFMFFYLQQVWKFCSIFIWWNYWG